MSRHDLTRTELLALVGLHDADTEIGKSERLLKVAQVAIIANLAPRTVWRDIKRGALEVQRMRVGRRNRTRVRLSEAKRYAFLVEQIAQRSER